MSSQAQNYEQSGEKRKLTTDSEEKAKLTPRTIRKAAKLSAENNPQLLAWIKGYPKKSEYYRGELFFDAQDVLKGLHIQPTTYAPTLSLRPDGRYQYQRVENYNLIWLVKNKQQERKHPTEFKEFEPSIVWTEDRWIFVRRMVGDEFAQKLFYKMCAFIWVANGVEKGKEIQMYQDALIEDVFGWRNKMDFVKKEKEPTEVSTWDGKYYDPISHLNLERLATQISVLGPTG